MFSSPLNSISNYSSSYMRTGDRKSLRMKEARQAEDVTASAAALLCMTAASQHNSLVLSREWRNRIFGTTTGDLKEP